MASRDSAALAILKDNIYQMVVLNPATVKCRRLYEIFAPDDYLKSQVDALLTELVDEKKIVREGKHGFRAVTPWADIAYAVIGQMPEKKTAAIPVQILNMPSSPDISVTMSRAEFNRHPLKEGDHIVAGLVRSAKGQADLRARMISTAHADKPFNLTGIFNHKVQRFKALDATIKTDFKLARGTSFGDEASQILVELPKGFDVRNPVVSPVKDQTRDAATGAPVSWIVASNHDIAHAHPEDVVREAKCINRSKLDLTGRVDLRHLDLVTVDPPGSMDLDDGFATEVTADGYALYTAIADVAALVPYKSAVDREAYARGITYYMNDHTSHMLPEILSTRKCSLLAGQDRLAIVVRQDLDWDCSLRGFEVMAAVVRSRDQLTYGQFSDLLERDDPRFRTIATIHNTRRAQGMNPALEAYLKTADKFSTKSINETLMVQTNSLTAQFLKEAGIPFLSRNFENGAQSGGQLAYYASYNLGHDAVGLLYYAHQSSPIRRYCDLVNGRAIHRALGNTAIGISDEEISCLDEIAAHLNSRRRVERNVARDIQKYHAVRELLRMQGTPVRIGVNDIGADYIDVSVAQTGVRQRIPAALLPANQWRIDGDKLQLVLLADDGRETRRYSRGESVLGQLYEIDPDRARWKVRLMPHDHVARMPAPPLPVAKP